MLHGHATFSAAPRNEVVSPLRDDEFVGLELGQWRVIRPLGAGAMATVWQVEHVELGTRAAAKVLRAQVLSDAVSVQTFREEARAAASLAHAHVVPVYETGVLSSGQPWLVMEYLEGRTLEAVLAAEDFSAERTTELVAQLARALEHAHARGVVHRDLKPANVLVLQLGARDFVKVVDFGIARVRDEAAMRGLKVRLGSPDYLAPEQINGFGSDARTDVYALGALAWQLLVGRPPFWHRPVNAVLSAHLHDAPESPSQHRSTVPSNVAAAVMKALAKNPDERFQTVGAFAYALQCAVANRPTPVPALDATLRGDSRHALLGANGVGYLVVCEHTSSAGCFVACDEALLVGTRVTLAFDALEPVAGVVVRAFDNRDAARWGRQPGFFVEFKNVSTAARVRLDGASTDDDLEAETTLERLRERLWGGAYTALGVSMSAETAELTWAHAQLDDALQALSEKQLSPRRSSELIAAQACLAQCARLLCDPRLRVSYDAERGNWRGVARCLEAGLSTEVLESLRFGFLKKHPHADLQARRHAERAHTLAAQGRRDEAFVAVETALSIDPLRLALHDLRAALSERERALVAH